MNALQMLKERDTLMLLYVDDMLHSDGIKRLKDLTLQIVKIMEKGAH